MSGTEIPHFFHAQICQRKCHNQTEGLLNKEGKWYHSHGDLEDIILDHFGNIFSTSQSSNEMINAVLERVQSKVSAQMNNSLL